MNTQPEFGELAEAQNLAQTLAHELKQPIELESPDELVHRIALPPGWKIEETDHIKLASAPRRKVARVTINDANSFADYILRHKLTSYSTLWCEADYRHGAVAFTAILNDHGGADAAQAHAFPQEEGADVGAPPAHSPAAFRRHVRWVGPGFECHTTGVQLHWIGSRRCC